MIRERLKNIFGKPNLPVYLGHVIVVPRGEFSKTFDPAWDELETDRALEKKISGLLELPPQADDIEGDHLILDTIISDYQVGMGPSFDPDIFWFALVSRPKISVKLRLRDGVSGEIRAAAEATEKISYRLYVSQSFNIKRGFRWNDEDLFEPLLLKALIRATKKLKNFGS